MKLSANLCDTRGCLVTQYKRRQLKRRTVFCKTLDDFNEVLGDF